MNQASEPMSEDSRNPWKRQSELPTPANGSVALSAALFLAASAALALSLCYEYVAIVLWGALIAGGFFLTRRHRRITALTVAFSLLGAVLPGGLLPLDGYYYPVAGAMVAAVCVGCGAGTYFQTLTKNYWALPLLTIVAAGVAYLLTDQWLLAVLAVALIPAVMLLTLEIGRAHV